MAQDPANALPHARRTKTKGDWEASACIRIGFPSLLRANRKFCHQNLNTAVVLSSILCPFPSIGRGNARKNPMVCRLNIALRQTKLNNTNKNH